MSFADTAIHRRELRTFCGRTDGEYVEDPAGDVASCFYGDFKWDNGPILEDGMEFTVWFEPQTRAVLRDTEGVPHSISSDIDGVSVQGESLMLRRNNEEIARINL